MECVGDDVNSVFHEDQHFFKNDTFESVTFEIFGKCSESVGFHANIDLQEDLKIFKSFLSDNFPQNGAKWHNLPLILCQVFLAFLALNFSRGISCIIIARKKFLQ